jgi:hypothetical protein
MILQRSFPIVYLLSDYFPIIFKPATLHIEWLCEMVLDFRQMKLGRWNEGKQDERFK